MHLTGSINIVEVLWVIASAVGLYSCLRLRIDAKIDVRARHAAGVNSGREDLAKLLVVTSTLMSIGFGVFLLAGLGAMTLQTSARMTPTSYFIHFGLLLANTAFAASVWYKQRVRQQVFDRDMKSEELRVAAAAMLAAEMLAANTDALQANTNATVAATDAMQKQGEEAGRDG